MKSITKILIASSIVVLVLFLWKEIPDLSIHKKINADKVSAFFTAIASLLTAVTVYLLYKQIQEQAEDRKAANRPDLYPASIALYTTDKAEDTIEGQQIQPSFIKVINWQKDESASTNIELHNIGLGPAKNIIARWHFDVNELRSKNKYWDPHIDLWEMAISWNYDFLLTDKSLHIQLPYIFLLAIGKMSSDAYFFLEGDNNPNLFLELTYEDVSDIKTSKYFRAKLDIFGNDVSIAFNRVDQIPSEYKIKYGTNNTQ